MKATVKGSIQPPRGTPGANGAFIVDLEVEIPNYFAEESARLDRLIEAITAKLGAIANEIGRATDERGR
jgi:hypothetical protein